MGGLVCRRKSCGRGRGRGGRGEDRMDGVSALINFPWMESDVADKMRCSCLECQAGLITVFLLLLFVPALPRSVLPVIPLCSPCRSVHSNLSNHVKRSLSRRIVYLSPTLVVCQQFLILHWKKFICYSPAPMVPHHEDWVNT